MQIFSTQTYTTLHTGQCSEFIYRGIFVWNFLLKRCKDQALGWATAENFKPAKVEPLSFDTQIQTHKPRYTYKIQTFFHLRIYPNSVT
jgi:hypothetical protein